MDLFIIITSPASMALLCMVPVPVPGQVLYRINLSNIEPTPRTD